MQYQKILFDKQKREFDDLDVYLRIGNIKATSPTIIKTGLLLFDRNDVVLDHIIGDDFIVAPKPTTLYQTFTLDEDTLNQTATYQIEIVTEVSIINNPLMFNKVMFSDEYTSIYSEPYEALPELPVHYKNNFYANYYKGKDYLQLIRPNYDQTTTKNINQSPCTVIAPHIANEQLQDTAECVGMEYMAMCDQTIKLER